VFKATELLGQILQSGMAGSTARRLHHALGPRGIARADGPLGAWLGQPADQQSAPEDRPVGLAESAREFIGADGSGRGVGPAGAMALFGGIALSALGRSQPAPDTAKPAPEAPLGLRSAQNAAEAERLDRTATLILAAMINAAKADGQVDQEELQRIVGRLRQAGAEAEALQFVMSELRKPMDLEGLVQDVPDQEVAVQLYAASLLAIEVDTDSERQYLRRLAHRLGLDASVVRRVHQCLGMEHGQRGR
jgi:uncharacterized membrane protein YebE (DUF533 family)